MRAVEVYAESLSPRSPLPDRLPSWSQVEASSSDPSLLEYSQDSVLTPTNTANMFDKTAESETEGSVDGFSDRAESDLHSDSDTQIVYLPDDEETKEAHCRTMDVSMTDNIPVTVIMGVEDEGWHGNTVVTIETKNKSEDDMCASMEAKSASQSSLDGTTESDDIGSPMFVSLEHKKESPDRMVLGNSQESLDNSDTFHKSTPTSIVTVSRDVSRRTCSPNQSMCADAALSRKLWKQQTDKVDNVCENKDENENGVQSPQTAKTDNKQIILTYKSKETEGGDSEALGRMTVSTPEVVSNVLDDRGHTRSLSSGACIINQQEDENEVFREESESITKKWSRSFLTHARVVDTGEQLDCQDTCDTEKQGVKRDSLTRDSVTDLNDQDDNTQNKMVPQCPDEQHKGIPAAKRKRSVKELMSKFEVLSQSPPKDTSTADIKYKPLVFQKPKIVHLKTLSPTNKDTSFFSSTFHKSDLAKDNDCNDSHTSHLTKPHSKPAGSTSPEVKLLGSRSTEVTLYGTKCPELRSVKLADTRLPDQSANPRLYSQRPQDQMSHANIATKLTNSMSKDKDSEPKTHGEKTLIIIAQNTDVSKSRQSSEKLQTQRDSSEERESSVRHLSQIFERRNSVQSSISCERQSAERTTSGSSNSSHVESQDDSEGDDGLVQSPKVYSKTPTKDDVECSVRKLSELFERQNSSQSTDSGGRRSAERSMGMDSEVTASSRPHSAGSTGSQGRGSRSDKAWKTIL